MHDTNLVYAFPNITITRTTTLFQKYFSVSNVNWRYVNDGQRSLSKWFPNNRKRFHGAVEWGAQMTGWRREWTWYISTCSQFKIPSVQLNKVKLSLNLTKYHAMKTHPVLWRSTKSWRWMGSGGTAPRILNLGPIWRWVIIFGSRALYPGEHNSRHPQHRRLDGHQSRSGRDSEEKKFPLCPCPESKPDLPAHSPVTISVSVFTKLSLHMTWASEAY